MTDSVTMQQMTEFVELSKAAEDLLRRIDALDDLTAAVIKRSIATSTKPRSWIEFDVASLRQCG